MNPPHESQKLLHARVAVQTLTLGQEAFQDKLELFLPEGVQAVFKRQPIWYESDNMQLLITEQFQWVGLRFQTPVDLNENTWVLYFDEAPSFMFKSRVDFKESPESYVWTHYDDLADEVCLKLIEDTLLKAIEKPAAYQCLASQDLSAYPRLYPALQRKDIHAAIHHYIVSGEPLDLSALTQTQASWKTVIERFNSTLKDFKRKTGVLFQCRDAYWQIKPGMELPEKEKMVNEFLLEAQKCLDSRLLIVVSLGANQHGFLQEATCASVIHFLNAADQNFILCDDAYQQQLCFSIVGGTLQINERLEWHRALLRGELLPLLNGMPQADLAVNLNEPVVVQTQYRLALVEGVPTRTYERLSVSGEQAFMAQYKTFLPEERPSLRRRLSNSVHLPSLPSLPSLPNLPRRLSLSRRSQPPKPF